MRLHWECSFPVFLLLKKQQHDSSTDSTESIDELDQSLDQGIGQPVPHFIQLTVPPQIYRV